MGEVTILQHGIITNKGKLSGKLVVVLEGGVLTTHVKLSVVGLQGAEL